MSRPAPAVSARLLSCGLLVINERGELLVGHSTGSPRWDLPKGLIDAGETPIACARREGEEEFGLAFEATRLVDLGCYAYYRGKDLHLFAVRTTTDETRPEHCRCTSHFEHTPGGVLLPEIDAYAWADDYVLQRLLGQSMRRLLLDKGLLGVARDTLGLQAAP